MKIIDVVQGSPEWYKIRRSIPTGSEFGRIITPGKGEYAAGAENYVAEIIAAALGWQPNFQGTPDTQRGNYLEKEAVRWLNLRHGLDAKEVGFCLSDCGRYGASPDGMLPGNVPLEVKCPALHTFLKWRMANVLPQDHKAQIHAEMFVCESDEAYFLAYADSPSLDNMLINVKRSKFTDALGECVLKFVDRLKEVAEELLGEEMEFYFPQYATATKEGAAA